MVCHDSHANWDLLFERVRKTHWLGQDIWGYTLQESKSEMMEYLGFKKLDSAFLTPTTQIISWIWERKIDEIQKTDSKEGNVFPQ